MKKENKKEHCPVSEATKVIGGKWRLQIIHVIGHEKRRFGALKKLLPTISEKMLIQELKHLTHHEILNRKAYKEIPPRVEYSLTEFGKKVLPIIDQMHTFGQAILDKTNRD
ncbi:MAG: winged helix-turn-helix transcriptional regulator [Aureispira sp.]